MEETERKIILEVKDLEKKFLGCDALRGVDMTIREGDIVGLLGPNASGKTTLLKTIAGLIQPTMGSITYYENAEGPEARKTIGFCPDTLIFPAWMRVRDAFGFYRDMYDDYSPERAEEIKNILGIKGDIENNKISRLSKGMRERLVLGLTFSRETKLYLMDEPLDGIDPVGKTKVIDAILAMKPEGSSALISTHLVKDVERILDNVYFLSNGKIIFNESCDLIREEKNQTVEQAYLEVFSNER